MKKIRYDLILVGLLLLSAYSMMAMRSPMKDIPISTTSTEAKDYVMQGLMMMDQGNGQKAKEMFTKAIEKDPKLGIAYILRAGESDSPKEFSDNLRMAKDNLDGASDWEKMYYEFYATYLTSDWNKRLEIAKNMVAAYPDAPRPEIDLGMTYMQGDDIAHAREAYQKAMQMDPGWTGAYYALWQTYIFNDPKDFKMATQYAQKLTELAPTSQGPEIALGDCYRAQNDLAKAKEAYTKAIDLDPSMSEPYYKRGHANTFMGMYDAARTDYKNGGKHDVTMTAANQFIGYTYLYSGDYPKAMSWFMDVAKKEDASGMAPDKIRMAKLTYYKDYADIAFHYSDASKLNQAIMWIEPLSTQVGTDIGTKEAVLEQQAYILYLKSLLLAVQGNYKDATAKAEQIKTTVEPIMDPNKLDNYNFAMGYISLRQKNYQAAVGDFKLANQNDVYTQYWLAKAYWESGDKKKADDMYGAIAQYNFNNDGYALIRSEVKKQMAMVR